MPHSLPGMHRRGPGQRRRRLELRRGRRADRAESGLGYRIMRGAAGFPQTDKIFAVLIVIGLIGLAIDIAAAAAARPGRTVGRDDRRHWNCAA